MPQNFDKDDDATLDYAIDWSEWLGPSAVGTGSDSISLSTWEAEEGITIATDPAPSLSGQRTTVWLSGGTVGKSYDVTNHIVTVAGREDDRTIRIYVREA
jgi:hypothetical protein